MLRRMFVAVAASLGLGVVSAAQANEGRSLRLPFAPTPENAAALAARAVAAVQNVDGKTLDYSPESLKEIDRIVLGFHDQHLTSDQVGETIFVMGCYVGEVAVRNLGAKWVMSDEKGKKLGFTMMGVTTGPGTFWDPIGKVFKRLQNGKEDSVYYLFSGIGSKAKPAAM